ncbi:MAG: ATP phosphoribosyltransferase regulatory subunit, partial [Dehalococcoidales bacterium]|nr:ATP phosphoribosyltransferase regulatory subunit [Dehalococcoidales bacterium]
CLVEALGYSYQIDITSGRGFEYYTGVIFQLSVGGSKIGGGGRYDALIPLGGGGNIPASGFALYFDQLMGLITPAGLAKSRVPGILIRAEPEVVKLGFEVANCLHDAGYTAELELGAGPSTNLRWRLDVGRNPPRLVLTDGVSHKRFEFNTTGEMLALLRERDADKDSFT